MLATQSRYLFVSFREPGARQRIGMCKDVLVRRFLLAAGLLPKNSYDAKCVMHHSLTVAQRMSYTRVSRPA